MDEKIFWKDAAPGCSKSEPFLQWGSLNSDFRLHRHDFCELVFILRGCAVHIINGEYYRLSPGHVYLLTGDMLHGFAGVSGLELVNILFHPAQVLLHAQLRHIQAYRALFEIEPRYRLSSGQQAWLTLPQPLLHDVEADLRQMYREQALRQEGYQLALQCMMNQLVVKLSRCYTTQAKQELNPPMQLAEAIAYMESHFTEDIRIADAAALTHYSTRHFCRLFHSLYGKPPREYLITLRLEQAQKLLRETTQSISEIAGSCGFSDSSYFTRLFGERLGATPRQFRKQTLHGKQNGNG